MKAIQLYEITPEELEKRIGESVKKELEIFKKNFKPEPPKEFLNRNQVATMLGVHVTSILNWERKGILNPLGISGKILFLRSEVEACLKPLNV
ncbi:MAG: DNA-binding protein [Flavobacterium sp.]|nr:MAG: DNA-binding protein [Flavobacterium sp.]